MKQLTTTNVIEELPSLLELAKTEPKIDLDDPRVLSHGEKRTMPSQFKDSFFMRFVEIRAVAEETATPQQITYLRMVRERFGLDLVRLSVELSELFGDVYKAIDAKAPYDQLAIGRLALLELESAHSAAQGTAVSLDLATDHPLGIEAIGMHYWDQLNPLLEQAYDVISERSLNAPFLAR